MSIRGARAKLTISATGAALIVSSMLSISACVLDGEADDVDRLEQKSVMGSDERNDIAAFTYDSTDEQLEVAAHYGTAVGWFQGAVHPCSAVLVNPSFALTATSCVRAGQTYSVTWGDFTSGESFARARQDDLGGYYGQNSTSSLTTFHCRPTTPLTTNSETYLSCDASSLVGLTVYPGDLWGYQKIKGTSSLEPQGTPVVGTFWDHAWGYADSTRVVLAPTGAVTVAQPCPGSDSDCFGHTLDTGTGALSTNTSSMGGSVMDPSTHELIGVHVEEVRISFGSSTRLFHVASQVPPLYSFFVPPTIPGSSTLVYSPTAGGTGGTESRLYCPTGMLVKGVIGTTYPDLVNGIGVVGNFGLICAPATSSNSIRDMKVLVGGSLYTNVFSPGMHVFNTYMHEELNLVGPSGLTQGLEAQRQSVQMCPPNQFVTAIRVYAGQFVDGIDQIDCQGLGEMQTASLRSVSGIGSASGTQTRLACPDGGYADGPDRAAAGLYIRSGWHTDRVGLICRQFRD